jgi:hypothetical protein
MPLVIGIFQRDCCAEVCAALPAFVAHQARVGSALTLPTAKPSASGN